MSFDAQLQQAIVKADDYFLDIVEQGSDHALFIAGYLQGHYFIVLAQAQLAETSSDSHTSLGDFKARMHSNVNKAFANHELESADQHAVSDLIEQLFAQPQSV
jgi:hypothetical protein